jgi:hypothetical protein
MRLCNRHVSDEGPSIRVWCRHVGWHPNTAITSGHRPTADDAGIDTAEKIENPFSEAVCLLTSRGLIRVRQERPHTSLLTP